MIALLEDRSAPLFNRVTDSIRLGHLDVASVLEILRVHADDSPERLLFLGHGLERLSAALYEERSKKGLGDFPLGQMVSGYWDRAGT